MRKSYYILLFLLITLIQTNSCKKIDLGTYKFNPKILGASIKTSVKGIIVDEFGNQVSGALITAGTQTVTSDIAGVFILENIDAYEKMGYIKVEKQGFFTGSRSFVPSSGGSNVVVRLLSNKPVGSIKAETGGKITAEGVEVSFSPGTIVKNNIPYAGSVNVSIQHIDPTSKNFEQEMPGNLFGLRDDNLMGLTSFGMVGVELKDDSGQPLQIAEGKKATVIFPIPKTLVSTAPQTIDLWSFDEENGFWVNEGKAQKQNDKYVADVGHFSFRNFDIPWNFVTLKGKVQLEGSDNIIQGLIVKLTSTSGGYASSFTNELGFFGGYVPKNEPLIIELFNRCTDGSVSKIYSGTIGPFTNDVTLPTIVAQGNLITGNVVDCSNSLKNPSYIISNGKIYFTTNGRFSFLTCDATNSILNITPYSAYPASGGIPMTIQVKGGIQDIGNLQACNSFGGAAGTVTDIDGNIYNTVKIGNQEWMAENLNTSKYRNGDPLFRSHDANFICESTNGVWSYLDNDSSAFAVPHGKLYNWFATVDSRGLCPTGWHVPNEAEWDLLINTVGGFEVAGKYLKSVGNLFWYSDNDSSTNSTGFSAHGGGTNDVLCDLTIFPKYEIYWWGYGGGYAKSVWFARWWSTTDLPPYDNKSKPIGYIMLAENNAVYKESQLALGGKQSLNSVRCIKD